MVHGKLSRPWDEFDAYLFDIDGTLIECTDAVHYFAFCDALSAVADRPINLDGVVAHGNTDVGILRDALAIAGIPESEWRSQVLEICGSMCAQVERNKHQLCVALQPRVRDVLHYLRAKGARLGVATGNLERIGKCKLDSAGLLELFDFAGWSDGFEQRADVFRHAMEEARIAVGRDAGVVVVGDTPIDVRAAKLNGLPVIAVATGVYSIDDLLAESPDLCIQSFEELVIAM